MKKILLGLTIIIFMCSCRNIKTGRIYSDGFFYTKAAKIGDKIYSGSKNKFINFNEDLTDIQVIYEYPDSGYYFWGILKLDESTICVCFWNSNWQGEEDIRREIYMIYDLKTKKAEPFVKNDIDVAFPFKTQENMYFFKKKYREFYLWSPVYSLYILSALDNEKLIADDINNFVICDEGLYFTYNQEANDEIRTIYFYNYKTDKTEEIVKIENLGTYKISGEFILYSVDISVNLHIYNMESKTTSDLEIETNFGSIDVNKGHIFIYQRNEDYYNYDIIDLDMSDLTMKEAVKTDLPGYIGDWHYYSVGPAAPEEEPIPAERLYTLWRSNLNGENQLVF